MNSNQKLITKTIVTLALLIAIEVVLSRFFSIATPIMKIGFAFLPLSIIALLYGWKYSAISAALADAIGAWLFPIGKFFLGFTITAFFAGLLYGIFLYNKPKKLLRVVCCVVAVGVVELIMNTFNIYLMSGKGFLVTLPTRLIQFSVLIPIKTITIWNVSYLLVALQKATSKKYP